MRVPDSAAHGLVSRADLESALAHVRQEVSDPRAGVFGPGSKVWEVNKESLVFLGAGRAALLQLAHPFVAHAIDQHSSTRHDPVGRFQRTFRQVFGMVFGDLDQAFRAARSVHGLHARIRGEIPAQAGRFAAGAPYFANDPDALLWVHATLWDTSILCYEAVRRPLATGEKEQYYRETRRFAWLFGIPDAQLPATWQAFRGYVDEMLASDTLAVTPCAAEIARFLFRAPAPGLGPSLRFAARLTGGLLPPRLARGFGLPHDPERTARDLARIRVLYPWLPRRLRHLPAYVEARRRLSGRTDRDLVGELLSRAMVGRARR